MRVIVATFLSLAFIFQGQASVCLIGSCAENLHCCSKKPQPLESLDCHHKCDCECPTQGHVHRDLFKSAENHRMLADALLRKEALLLIIRPAYSGEQQGVALIEAPSRLKTLSQFGVWRL